MKGITCFIIIAIILLFSVGYAVCDGDMWRYAEFHTCEYNKTVVADEYKRKGATCEDRAIYYYSCKCGAKGDKTFFYGQALGHDYHLGECTRCDSKKFSENLGFTLINGDTEYAISGIGTCTDLEIVIPLAYNDKPVTSIIGEAFNSNNNIIAVVIPNSITNISANAFVGCENLTIYCVAESKPDGWSSDWNANCLVVWGYDGN